MNKLLYFLAASEMAVAHIIMTTVKLNRNRLTFSRVMGGLGQHAKSWIDSRFHSPSSSHVYLKLDVEGGGVGDVIVG